MLAVVCRYFGTVKTPAELAAEKAARDAAEDSDGNRPQVGSGEATEAAVLIEKKKPAARNKSGDNPYFW
jgi:hypothetical protein